MRATLAIVLALVISGCGTEAASLAGSAAGSASAAASASPQASGPDWSSVPGLDLAVDGSVALPTAWTALLGAAPLAHGSLWVSNGSELGEPPRLRRLDPDDFEVTAVIDLGGEADVFPPDAYGAAPSANGIWVPLGRQKAVVLVDPATNSVSRRIEVDANPYGLLEDGDDLWITDFGSSEVLRIDIPTGEEQMRVAVPDPTWMVIGPEGLWVIEHAEGYVTRLDPANGEQLARVDVGGRPCIALGLGSVWSGSNDERTVARIDPSTNQVVATIELPESGCGGVVAGGSVWVATSPQRGACERTSYLVRIDPAVNAIDGMSTLPCVGIVAADGDRLLISTTEAGVTSLGYVDTRPR